MPKISGACHCGNLRLTFRSTVDSQRLPVRACQCTFCHPRRMRWTSDPDGEATIHVQAPEELSRYRFGTATAEFLICRRCGYLLAALDQTGDRTKAVINVDVLETRDEFGPSKPMDFDGETREVRLQRRSGSWTPARLEIVDR